MKILLFIFIPFLILGQTITSVSGILNNNEIITIGGSSFGTKTAAPLVSSYNDATSANNWSTGSIGGGWFTGGTVSLIATSPRTVLPQSSYKIRYNQAGDYASIRYEHLVADDHLYISFWIYRDYTPWNITAGSGNNSKFLRIYTDGGGSGGNMYDRILTEDSSGDLTDMGSSGDNIALHTYTISYTACDAFKYSSNAYDVHTTTCLHQLQTWTHCEYVFDYPSSLGAADGAMTVIYGGKTVARSTGITMNNTGQDNDQRYILVGHVSGARTSTGYEYIDQEYIDNTWARVFISDVSNITSSTDYGSLNHREIQVPSSWSASSIALTLNRGTFAADATVYLYVVTSTGAISNGYEITFGGESEDTTPPVAANSFIATSVDSSAINIKLTQIPEWHRGIGRYNSGSYPTTITGGISLFDTHDSTAVNNDNFSVNLICNTTYYVTAFLLDSLDNCITYANANKDTLKTPACSSLTPVGRINVGGTGKLGSGGTGKLE